MASTRRLGRVARPWLGLAWHAADCQNCCCQPRSWKARQERYNRTWGRTILLRSGTCCPRGRASPSPSARAWVPVRKRAEDIAVPPEVLCLLLQRQAALANLVFLRLGVDHDGGLATNTVRATCWTLLKHIPGVHGASIASRVTVDIVALACGCQMGMA